MIEETDATEVGNVGIIKKATAIILQNVYKCLKLTIAVLLLLLALGCLVLLLLLALGCLEYVFGSSTRPIFPMDDTSSIHECMTTTDLQMGDTTAKLSDWIYSPYEKSEKDGQMAPLPEGLHTESEHIHMVSRNSNIQWAKVTSDDTVYIVFKGTSSAADAIIDLNGNPIPVLQQHKETKSAVHGGIWNALHFAGNEATKNIKGVLKAAIAKNPTIKVVLCGHSLGGAYAILCALELLHGDDPVRVDAVIGHGAPQVIEPNTESANKVWNELNDITTIYVNEYDLVPRLPSCHLEWKETFNNLRVSLYKFFPGFPSSLSRFLPGFPSFVSRFGLELISARDMMERVDMFRHVGRLVFVAKNNTGITNCWVQDATAKDGKDGDGWDVLSTPPAWSGNFIIENHTQYPQVLRSLLQTLQTLSTVVNYFLSGEL